MGRGFFIVFEGPDGSGKSTQADMLYKRLSSEGYHCLLTEEPGGTPQGEKISELLLNPDLAVCSKAELFLFLADRSEHVRSIIAPSLEAGKIVICSRYYFSTLVYQGMARKVADLEFLLKLNLFAVDGLQPDTVFYLDLSPEIGLANARTSLSKPFHKRGGDRIEKEDLSFHRLVREGYLELARRFQNIFVVLDGGAPIDEIGTSVYAVTKRRLTDD